MKNRILHLAVALMVACAASAELSEAEQRILREYETQERKFQQTAIRTLSSQSRQLQKEIRAIRHDRDVAESERERRASEIQKQADAIDARIKAIREGEVVIPPEFRFDRLRVGDVATIKTSGALNGYWINSAQASVQGHTVHAGWDVYVHGRDGRILNLQIEDSNGARLKKTGEVNGKTWQIISRKEKHRNIDKDNPDTDKYIYHLRQIDIDDLRDRAEQQ